MPSHQIHLAKVEDECLRTFEEMNNYRTTTKYTIFSLNDDESKIIIEKIGGKESTYNDFVEDLSQYSNEPRWALLNFEYKTVSGGKRKKLAFVSWVPDTISRSTMKDTIRVKTSAILYQKELKKNMRGVVCTIQANDADELEKLNILSWVARHERDEIDGDSIMA